MAYIFTTPVTAGVIASCGPMEGYTYYFGNELNDYESEWAHEPMVSMTIFLGSEEVEEVVITGKGLTPDEESWTRSSADYNAVVAEIFREGSLRHILVHWGPTTELYAINTENKTVSLVAVKGGVIDLARAIVGKCE